MLADRTNNFRAALSHSNCSYLFVIYDLERPLGLVCQGQLLGKEDLEPVSLQEAAEALIRRYAHDPAAMAAFADDGAFCSSRHGSRNSGRLYSNQWDGAGRRTIHR
jgi:hypothetical protein